MSTKTVEIAYRERDAALAASDALVKELALTKNACDQTIKDVEKDRDNLRSRSEFLEQQLSAYRIKNAELHARIEQLQQQCADGWTTPDSVKRELERQKAAIDRADAKFNDLLRQVNVVTENAMMLLGGGACERHSGKNCPPFEVFAEKIKGCCLCHAEEREQLRAKVHAFEMGLAIEMMPEAVKENAKMRADLKKCVLLGQWMSAALDDPKVCPEMKEAAEKFLEAIEPYVEDG